MARQLIDKATGQLLLTNNFIVSPQTKPGELIHHFGDAYFKITDVHNGWKNYVIWNVKLCETYFAFTFYFEDDVLKSINFNLNDELIVAGSWDTWSEKEQLQKKDDYDYWLTKEIGKVREFQWGTIGAFYDIKGGGTSIFLRYKDKI